MTTQSDQKKTCIHNEKCRDWDASNPVAGQQFGWRRDSSDQVQTSTAELVVFWKGICTVRKVNTIQFLNVT